MLINSAAAFSSVKLQGEFVPVHSPVLVNYPCNLQSTRRHWLYALTDNIFTSLSKKQIFQTIKNLKMKRLFSTIAMMMAILITANAQGKSTKLNPQDVKKAYMFATSEANSSAINAADVNTHALKDFNKSFKNVTGEQWYAVSDGFVANFNQEGIETKVAYDQKGKWHCTVRTLTESQLPSDVRDLVKSRYYDYDILVVYEIKHDNTAYIMKMENGTNLKMIRVVDGEIEIISDNTKG